MGHSPDTAPESVGKGQLAIGLRLFDASTIIIGSMIGSGIFIVSADMARVLGSPGLLLVSWIIAAVMTILAALSYGELAAAMPRAGGQYVFLREAFGPLFGFLYGWTLFLVIQTGTIAAVVVAFAKFSGLFVPWISASRVLVPLPFGYHVSSQHLAAIVVLAFLTWVNCAGLREGATVQNIFTVAKVGGLLVLVVIGLLLPANPSAAKANFSQLFPGSINLAVLAALGGTLVGSLFASDAWNNVTFTGSEVMNPRRNLPLALLIGTGTVSLVYICTNIVYLKVLPLTAIASAPEDRVGTLVAQSLMGPWGLTFINLAVLVSTFGCANGMILAGARVYYAMASDGLFFRKVARISPRRRTPVFSLVIQAIWTSFLVLSGTYSELLDYVIFAALLFYVLTVIGLFVLRKKRPDLERPYKAFGYPVLPAIYVILASLVMIDLLWVKPKFTWPGLIIVLTGVPVYFYWSARRQKHFVEELKARLFTIWCWSACAFSTAFWGTLSILGSLVSGSGKFQHYCMYRWSKDNLWVSRTRVQIEGLEHIDPNHPQILVANHSGLHDILSLAANLPIQFRWVAKKSLFSVPFMGWHMRRAGYFAIDYENPRGTAKSIGEAARAIQSGMSAIVFPEGSRSVDGVLNKFYSGAFSLALRTGVPLVPVSLDGSYRVIVPMTRRVNPGVILRIKIGRPVDLSAYTKVDRPRLMEDVFQIMSRNLEEIRGRRQAGEESQDPVFRWVHPDASN
ncbi:MAG TPA: amino acid permease [Acidobacteriota bacterium]|nr:amino acid permease [Acidobacteriota bacterium]